jgi:hypothetical protein
MLPRAAVRALRRIMPRNAEVIRQWQVLGRVEATWSAAPIDEMPVPCLEKSRDSRPDPAR